MIHGRENPGLCTAALLIGAAVLFPLPGTLATNLDEHSGFDVFTTREMLSVEDQELAEIVAAEWPGLTYDSTLARAARAYAAASADGASTTLTSDELRLILSDAGLPESTAVCAVVSTTEEGFDDVLDHLPKLMSTAGEVTDIGLGRAPATRAPFKWLWAILLVERRIDLVVPIPRHLAPDGAAPIRFRMRPGWSSPRLVVHYPNGLTRKMTPARDRGDWFTVVPAGRQPGQLTLQISATGPMGPHVAAQMPIQIGTQEGTRSDAAQNTPSWVDESAIVTSTDAEALLVRLINDERTAAGLEALEWDAELAEAARAHSIDMSERGYLSHVSPFHGNLQERLARADLITTVARENVARDTSLVHAHRSLMASPGHRANIVARDVDRVGVGVVADRRPGVPLHWVVTEIFTRPYLPPTFEDVFTWRMSSRSTQCHRDPLLDEVAAWLVAMVPDSTEADDSTFEELKGRLHKAGSHWVRLSTEIAIVRTPADVERVVTVNQEIFTSCGMAARRVAGLDGHDGVMLGVIMVQPREPSTPGDS